MPSKVISRPRTHEGAIKHCKVPRLIYHGTESSERTWYRAREAKVGIQYFLGVSSRRLNEGLGRECANMARNNQGGTIKEASHLHGSQYW
jgi:hypothetical protein